MVAGGLIGDQIRDVQDTARTVSETTDLVLRLVDQWNTVCDVLALLGVGWSLYWIRHDAVVREAETGETGLLLREVLILAAVNFLVWLTLRGLWAG